jgi:hypothetical protein
MSIVPAEDLAKCKGPLSRLTLEYSYIMKDLVKQAKNPAFTPADWAPLAELVAVDEWERTGNFRETIRWDQYDDLLTIWARNTVWDFTVRRVTEGDGYAILELEERAGYPDRDETYCSVSVYEFNAANKLRHLEIYLSKAEPESSSMSHQWDLTEVEAAILPS